MKIRIKKNKIIQERDMSTGPSDGYNFTAYYKKFLDKKSRDYIFKKKIILYDLETKGLLPSPYIHQFAALEFDLSNEGLEGINVDNLNADDAFIAKCYYSYDDMKGQDTSFLRKRQNFLNSFIKQYNNQTKQFPWLINVIQALMTNYNFKNKTTYVNMKISKNNMPKLYGAMVFGMALTEPSVFRKKNKSVKAEDIPITDLSADYYNFVSSIVQKAQNNTTFANDKEIQAGLDKYFKNIYPNSKSDSLKIIFDSFKEKPQFATIAQRRKLQNDPNSLKEYSDFWKFISRLKDNYGIGHTEDNYYDLYNPFSLTMKKIKDDVGMSYEENKVFTNYKSFPLAKYVKYNNNLAKAENDAEFKNNYSEFVPTPNSSLNRNDSVVPEQQEGQPPPVPYDTTLVSEKHALKSFLEWFGKKQKDKFLLMGQNIAAFDNAVIQNRAKFYGLQSTFIDNFFDSAMFDTLSFFRTLFIPTMKFYEKVRNDIKGQEEMIKFISKTQESEKITSVMASLLTAQKKLDEMRKMYPNLRSKLDGLMVMFYGEKHIQTHTADDDCEQLLRIFLPSFLEVKNMIHFFGDNLYDLQNILKDVFGDEYEIEMGIKNYKIPSEKQKTHLKLKVDEVKKIASKLKNDILVYAEFDEQEEKIIVYDNKDFDTQYKNFTSIFGSSGGIFEWLRPQDYDYIVGLKNKSTPSEPEKAILDKLKKQYPLGILERLGDILKVVFVNYIISEYNRKNYNDVFKFLKYKRKESIALLRRIIREQYKLPPSKIPKQYNFIEKYLDKDFYAKNNADETNTMEENKKKLKIKILKENKNGK
jgi:hypothetical protein